VKREMPYTHGHAVVNVWILGRWPLPANDHRLWVPILLGGMIPDLPLLVFMLMEVPKHGGDAAFDDLYFQQPWQDIFGYFHSIPLTFFATLILMAIAVFVYARTSKEESSVQEVLIKILNYTRDMAGARKTATSSTSGGGRGESSATPAETDLEEQQQQESPSAVTTVEVGQSLAPPPTARDQHSAGSSSTTATAPVAANAVVIWSQAAWLFTASWFLHALADLGLHTADAHSEFLPFSRVKLRSKISYYDVTEYAYIWTPIEFLLVFMACRFMWRNITRRWCRFLLYMVVVSYIVLFVGTCISVVSLMA
jgi:hypothetical protein